MENIILSAINYTKTELASYLIPFFRCKLIEAPYSNHRYVFPAARRSALCKR